MTPSRADIVSALKHLQRTNSAAKEAWHNFCDAELNGIRDPNKHDDTVITHFLEMNGGAEFLISEAASKSPPTQTFGGMNCQGKSKAELVDALKNLQRSNSNAKEAWHTFCDTELGGIRDPNRHDATALYSFLESNGGAEFLVAEAASKPTAPKFTGMMAQPGKSKTELVEALKNLQRSDAGAKESWHSFCDTQLNGIRDPNRHDATVLQRFLSSTGCSISAAPIGNAAFNATAPAGGNKVLVDAIKAGQRASVAWKNGWQSFVDASGSKYHDPAKHDEAFLTSFFDQCGHLISQQFGGGGADLPAAKRARTSGPDVASSGNAQKDDLVQRVKKVQRASEDFKAAWHNHSDTLNNGIRDPAKHPIESLENFLLQHESSVV